MSNTAKSNTAVTEELDFQYLLELLGPLYSVPEYAWLPELFSIVGNETLLRLCKYAGGEIIKIPTLNQLADSIDALQNFYDVEIAHRKDVACVPVHILPLFMKIREIYNARESEEAY